GTGKRPLGLTVPEAGKVHTDADKGLELRAGVKVILQRDDRRQVLDGADLGPVRLDRMLEGQGAQHLDADIVADAIFEGDRGPDIVVEAGRHRAPRLRPVVRLGVYVGNPKAKRPFPLRLSKRGRS